MSWAALAGKDAAPTGPPKVEADDGAGVAVAVVDANAIIDGLRLEGIAEKAYTIAEVLAEIKDKAARDFLNTLPFGLEVREPSAESVKAVTLFARATGDLHSLSEADIKLIALAHTLEVVAHGSAHLREKPVQAKTRSKRRGPQGQLPGWGSCDNPEEWAELDALEEQEAAEAAAAAGNSTLEPEEGSKFGGFDLSDVKDGEEAKDGFGEEGDDAPMPDEGNEESDEDADDGGWETAASSRNAARRKERKARRRANREAEEEAEAAEHLEEDPHWGAEAGAEEEEGEEWKPNVESSIASVTADFAMQNVILQMGLRLVAKDGRRITKLSRYALRCQACFFVCREAGRMFCPQCGNATMERVEVSVGADGVEQFGVRKKHVLKGTRYSLPKPKGGRHRDPILREDVMAAKLPHLLNAQKKAAADADPFAPEFGMDTVFANAVRGPGGAKKGLEHLTTSARNNPNERKCTRTNRRR